MSDLFPDAHQDSPRLQWMKRWGVHIRKDGSRYIAEIDEELWGCGGTPDEAIEDFVASTGYPHYKEPIL